jgi:hypothetical protein
MVLAAMVLTFAYVAHTQQLRLSVARAPLWNDGQGAFDYSVQNIIVDGTTAELLYLWPNEPAPPVPLGLDRWPEPGEAVVSPALARRWNPPGLRISGEIGADGLVHPDEMIGYVVPPSGAVHTGYWFSANEFGSRDLSARIGPTLYGQPVSQILVLLLITILIPSAILLASATRSATRPTDRTARIIEQLGASPSAVRRGRLRRLAPAIAGGALGAGVVSAVPLACDIHLAYLDYWLLADQLRAGLPTLLGGFGVGCAAVLAVMVPVCHPGAPMPFVQGDGNRNRRVRHLRVATIAATVLALVAVRMASQAIVIAPNQFLWWFMGAIIFSIAAVPLLCRAAAGFVAAAARRLGVSRSWPGMIIAGRHIDADRGNWRYAAVVGVLLTVVAQVFVAQLVGLRQAKEARLMQDTVAHAYTTLTLRVTETPATALEGLSAETFVGTPFVFAYTLFSPATDETSTHVIGDAAALESFGLEPAEGLPLELVPTSFARIIESVGGVSDPVIAVADPFDPPVGGAVYAGGALVLNAVPDDPKVAQITDLLASASAPPLLVQLPGDGSAATAPAILTQGRWCAALGVLAAAMLSLASLMRQTTVMDRTIGRTQALAAIYGDCRLGGRVIGCQVLPMVVIGSVVGGTFAIALGSILTSQGAGAGPPYVPVASIVVTCLVFAASAAAVYWIKAGRAASRWTPASKVQEG